MNLLRLEVSTGYLWTMGLSPEIECMPKLWQTDTNTRSTYMHTQVHTHSHTFTHTDSMMAELFHTCSNVRRSTDWNRSPWPDTTVTICLRYFITGGPGEEHRTNKPPPIRRIQARSKGDTTCLTTSQNPSLWHPSWLNKAAPGRTLESEWLARDNPETNPIT